MRGLPMDAVEAEQYLAMQAALGDAVTDSWHGYAVEHRGDARVIGDIGVYLDATVEATGDVGFQFRPDYHRRGYAYEAMVAFLPWVFGTLGLRRVTARCAPANTASWGLMQRLGMSEVAQPPDATARCYELLQQSWRRRDQVCPDAQSTGQ